MAIAENTENTNTENTEAVVTTKKQKTPEGRVVSKKNTNTTTLKDYLSSLELEVNPTVHVNGHNFSMAIVTVDFGQPLKPVKLNADQTQMFTEHLKTLTKEIIGRDGNIRISHDSAHGVYWSSCL